MKLDIQLFTVEGKTTTLTESGINQTNNTSNLSIKIEFSASSSQTFFNSKTLKCTCNGETKSANVTLAKGGSVSKTFTFTDIAHNQDGNKTVDWSWTITTGTSGLGTVSSSGSKVLTRIPRGSILGNIDDFIISVDTVIPISITKYLSSFTDKLMIKIGNNTIKTINGITNGSNVVFISSEVATMEGLFTGASTVVTFLLETYDGSTLVGSDIQTATGLIPSRLVGFSRYSGNPLGYLYGINTVLDKTLNPGLQVGGDLYLNGKSFIPVEVSITGLGSGSTYICYYYPSTKLVYLTIYLTGKSLSANSPTTIGTVSSGYRPARRTALSCYALQDYAGVLKANVNDDGIIQLLSSVAKTSSDDEYISGVWFVE